MDYLIDMIFSLIKGLNNLVMNFNADVSSLFSILAILASLFIPLAVIFFEQIKNNKSQQYPILDKKIIFNKILKAGHLYITIIASCILLLFWKYEYTKTVGIIVFLVATIRITISMINIYRWLKNDFTKSKKYKNIPFQDKKRLDYLSHNSNEGESVVLWNEIWKKIGGSTIYIIDYLETYINTVKKFGDEFYYDTNQFFLKSLEDNNYSLNNSFQEALIKHTVPSCDDDNTLLIATLRNDAISKIIHKFLCDNPYGHLQVFNYALDEKNIYDGMESHIFPAIYEYFDSIKDAYENKTLKPVKTFIQSETINKKKTTLDYIFDVFNDPLLHGIDRLYYSLPTNHKLDAGLSKPTFSAKCIYDAYRQWIMNEMFRNSYDKPKYDTQELYRIITRTACSELVVSYNYLDDCIYIPYFLHKMDQLDLKELTEGIKNTIDHSFGYLPYSDINNPIDKKIPKTLINMGYSYKMKNINAIKKAVNNFDYKKHRYNNCSKDEARINIIMLKRILNQSKDFTAALKIKS